MTLSDALRRRDAIIGRMMARRAAMLGDVFGESSEGAALDRAIEASGEDVGFSHPSFSFRRAPTPSYSRPAPSFSSFRTAAPAPQPVFTQPASSRFANFASPSLQAAVASQPFTRTISPSAMLTAPIATPASLLTAPISAPVPGSSRWAQFRDPSLTAAVQSQSWTSNPMSPTARLLADPAALAASASAAVTAAKLATTPIAPIVAPLTAASYQPFGLPPGGDGGGGGGGDGGAPPGSGPDPQPTEEAYADSNDPGGPNGPDPGPQDYPSQGPDDYPFPDDGPNTDEPDEDNDSNMGWKKERNMIRLAYDKLGKAEILDVKRGEGKGKREELEKVVCSAIARGEDPLAIANRLGKAGVPVMAIKNAINKCQAKTGGTMIRSKSSSMGAGSRGLGVVALRRKLRGIGMNVKADGDVDQPLADAVNGIFKGWDDAPKGLQAGDMTPKGLRDHIKLVNQLVDKAIGGAQHLENADRGV